MFVKLRNLLIKFNTNRTSNSYITKLRKKRFSIFEELICTLRKKLKYNDKIKILDIGGTFEYLQQIYDTQNNPLNLEITLLNLELPNSKLDLDYFKAVIGNAKGCQIYLSTNP
ncbi:MAG: hypothetical protein QMC67_14490 [Candidatus Wallbacteria bacterium]